MIPAYFTKFKRGVDFMEGRDKIDLKELCTGEPMKIVNVAFLPGENSNYAVFTVDKRPDNFVFGNSVVTEILEEIQKDGMIGELAKVDVVFREVTSKKNRAYIAMDFVEAE